jgi:hypothetical protein
MGSDKNGPVLSYASLLSLAGSGKAFSGKIIRGLSKVSNHALKIG